jgi:hypothetical protein
MGSAGQEPRGASRGLVGSSRGKQEGLMGGATWKERAGCGRRPAMPREEE